VYYVLYLPTGYAHAVNFARARAPGRPLSLGGVESVCIDAVGSVEEGSGISAALLPQVR